MKTILHEIETICGSKCTSFTKHAFHQIIRMDFKITFLRSNKPGHRETDRQVINHTTASN